MDTGYIHSTKEPSWPTINHLACDEYRVNSLHQGDILAYDKVHLACDDYRVHTLHQGAILAYDKLHLACNGYRVHTLHQGDSLNILPLV